PACATSSSSSTGSIGTGRPPRPVVHRPPPRVVEGSARRAAPDSADRWHRALAEAGHRAVRVVVVADSIGELSNGFSTVWRRFHRHLTADPPGSWDPPRRMDGVAPWPLLPGEPAAIGLEARGQLLRRGDGPA